MVAIMRNQNQTLKTEPGLGWAGDPVWQTRRILTLDSKIGPVHDG